MKIPNKTLVAEIKTLEHECETLKTSFKAFADMHWNEKGDTTARIQNLEASNQQLSQEHGRISNVAQQFAKDKERDAETIARLVGLLDGAARANDRLNKERDRVPTALEAERSR